MRMFVREALIAPLMVLVLLCLAGAPYAQETMSRIEDFDPGRAILNDEPWFDPFRPSALEPLGAALKDGRLT